MLLGYILEKELNKGFMYTNALIKYVIRILNRL